MAVTNPSNPSGTASTPSVTADYLTTHTPHEAESGTAVNSDDRLATTSGHDESVSPQRAFETLQLLPSCSQRQQGGSSMSLISLLTNGLTHSASTIPDQFFSAVELGYDSNGIGLRTTATDGEAPQRAQDRWLGEHGPAAAFNRRRTTTRPCLRVESDRRRAVRRRVMHVLDEVLDELGEGPTEFSTLG